MWVRCGIMAAGILFNSHECIRFMHLNSKFLAQGDRNAFLNFSRISFCWEGKIRARNRKWLRKWLYLRIFLPLRNLVAMNSRDADREVQLTFVQVSVYLSVAQSCQTCFARQRNRNEAGFGSGPEPAVSTCCMQHIPNEMCGIQSSPNDIFWPLPYMKR